MKRSIALLALALALLLGVGCAPAADVDSPETGTGSGEEQPAAEDAPAPAEAMPTDGPGESAAVAELPAALGKAEKASSIVWPDLSGAEPSFTAYLIAAEMDGQLALFEVRADGVVHGLYAYQKAFDAGTLLWTPSADYAIPRVAPQGDAERAAVASVEAAMRDSFPDAAFTVGVYGYRFEYVKDGGVLMILEVATDGSVISAGV